MSYVGVPALTGVTWPLGWRSVPTEGRLFVVGALPAEVAGRLLPLSDACSRNRLSDRSCG